jgi:hypothetical protein
LICECAREQKQRTSASACPWNYFTWILSTLLPGDTPAQHQYSSFYLPTLQTITMMTPYSNNEYQYGAVIDNILPRIILYQNEHQLIFLIFISGFMFSSKWY